MIFLWVLFFMFFINFLAFYDFFFILFNQIFLFCIKFLWYGKVWGLQCRNPLVPEGWFLLTLVMGTPQKTAPKNKDLVRKWGVG